MAGITVCSSSSLETENLGRGFSLTLGSLPATIALRGQLGAGKTTWVRGLVSGLGGRSEEVNSPTFIYLNIYQTRLAPVYHFDLYRLNLAEEFLEKGFDEYLEKDGVTIIEWPERIPSLLPSNTLSIKLEHKDTHSRTISWVY